MKKIIDTIKQDKSLIWMCVSVLLGILCIIFYGILNLDGENWHAAAFVLLALAVACSVAYIVCAFLLKGKAATYAKLVLYIAPIALDCVSLIYFLNDRIEWMYYYLSKMEVAEPGATFVLAIIFYVAAIAFAVVPGFFTTKEEKEAATASAAE